MVEFFSLTYRLWVTQRSWSIEYERFVTSPNDGYVAYYLRADVSDVCVVFLCDEMEVRNVCTQTRKYGISRAFFLSLGGRNG